MHRVFGSYARATDGARGASALARRLSTLPRVGVERRRGNPIVRPQMDRPHGGERAGPVVDPRAGVDRAAARPLLPLLRGPQGLLHPAGLCRPSRRTVAHARAGVAAARRFALPDRARAGAGGGGADRARRAPSAPLGARGFAAARSRAFRARSRARRCRTSRRPMRTCENDRREIVLYYHGLDGFRSQHTRVATSSDGIRFQGGGPSCSARPTSAPSSAAASGTPSGCRASSIARAMACRVRAGADSFPPTMRHCAVQQRGDTLLVFWTRVAMSPSTSCSRWWRCVEAGPTGEPASRSTCSTPSTIGRAPIARSFRRCATPSTCGCASCAIPPSSKKDGRTWLLYAVAGEAGHRHRRAPPRLHRMAGLEGRHGARGGAAGAALSRLSWLVLCIARRWRNLLSA